jgi:hypothetical protein
LVADLTRRSRQRSGFWLSRPGRRTGSNPVTTPQADSTNPTGNGKRCALTMMPTCTSAAITEPTPPLSAAMVVAERRHTEADHARVLTNLTQIAPR